MFETLLNIDGGLLLLIQDYVRNPILDSIMIFITTLGNGGMIWIFDDFWCINWIFI